MEPNDRPRKTKMIVFRSTPAEVAAIKENAKKRNMSLSRYIRYRCLFDKN
jgi:hypothetical protein